MSNTKRIAKPVIWLHAHLSAIHRGRQVYGTWMKRNERWIIEGSWGDLAPRKTRQWQVALACFACEKDGSDQAASASGVAR
jgi:hypothetical protein